MSDTQAVYNICEPRGKELGNAPWTLLLLRDASILAALLWLVQFSAQLAQPWPTAAVFTMGIAAFAVGLWANSFAHEWGHYCGAVITGSRAPRNGLGQLTPMFHFDIEQNSTAQFVAMSLGGNVFQWLFAGALLFALDSGSIVIAGLQSGALAFAVAGSLLEMPIALRALHSGDSAAAWQDYLPKRSRILRSTLTLGLLSGIASWAWLVSH